jgi:hypothetical protein
MTTTSFYMLEVAGRTYTTCPQPEGVPFAVAAQLIQSRLGLLAALPDETPVILQDARGEVVGTARSGRSRHRAAVIGRYVLADFRRLGATSSQR